MAPNEDDANGVLDRKAAAESGSLILVRQARLFAPTHQADPNNLRRLVGRAIDASLVRSLSPATRTNYAADLNQFLDFLGVSPDEFAASGRSP